MKAGLELLRWLRALAGKLLRVVPFATTSVVAATLASQVAVLLAFFLPLKVVVLLASPGMPRYFPNSWQALDRDLLVTLLALATAAAYLLHLLLERLIRWVVGRGAERLLKRSHKLILFENQDEIVALAYRRYAGALASGVFALLALAVVAWLYPALGLLVLAYLATLCAGLALAGLLSGAPAEAIATRALALASVLGGVGFLLGFAWLVADFLRGAQPALIPAIISLLLMRQFYNRLATLLQDVAWLQAQRQRLDVLLFHGRMLMPRVPAQVQDFWSLQAPALRRGWVDVLLADHGLAVAPTATLHWRQSDVPDVACLLLQEAGTPRYLIKLFAPQRRTLARHEATLLAARRETLPALALGAVAEVEGMQCHVLVLDGYQPAGDRRDARRLALELRAALLAVPPPEELAGVYRRSRPLLWQRLEAGLLQRLEVAVEGEPADGQLKWLAQRLDAWCEVLRTLPLALLPGDFPPGLLWRDDAGQPRGGHWGRWALEPVGADWPVQPDDLAALPQQLAVAARQRVALAAVSVDAVRLAALTAALEREVGRQRLKAALELLPELAVTLARLEPAAGVISVECEATTGG